MRIKSVRIENFRSIRDETIQLDEYTCFVGPNGAGKSNVLRALNVFFRESDPSLKNPVILEEDDFHNRDIKNPIRITVTFCDLSKEAQKDFSDYYRQEQLIVSAIANYSENTGTAEVKQYGQRLGISQFSDFFKALNRDEKVAELKEIYLKIQSDYPDLPNPGTKQVMIDNLHDYENNHPGQCIPIPSEDQFYGFSRGVNRLSKYLQWVFVPAVKDVGTEQAEAKNTAIGKLLQRTVRTKLSFTDAIDNVRSQAQDGYQDILKDNQKALDELSDSLNKRIMQWAHPGASLKLAWWQDPDKAVQIAEPIAHALVGEGIYEGEVFRFGHGLQRSYLLAVLQELASDGDSLETTLILACEEPELYQHPPQAQHLAHLLRQLSEANAQILLTTHSPYFVDGRKFNNVRVVRQVDSATNIYLGTVEQVGEIIANANDNANYRRESGVLAKIHQTLQPALNEMFFTNQLILVEGIEDVAYISAYLHLLSLWEHYRRNGCLMVPTDGKHGIIEPFAIAIILKIPTFVVFDSDSDKPHKNGSRQKHENDNRTILRLAGIVDPVPFPEENLWEDNLVMWESDIAKVVSEEIGENIWKDICNEADKEYGQIGGLRKNTLHIGWSLNKVWERGLKSDSLQKLCNKIIKFTVE